MQRISARNINRGSFSVVWGQKKPVTQHIVKYISMKKRSTLMDAAFSFVLLLYHAAAEHTSGMIVYNR